MPCVHVYENEQIKAIKMDVYLYYCYSSIQDSWLSLGGLFSFLLRFKIQILAWGLAILTEAFCGFPQSIQGNAGIVRLIRP
jgi:hypothetical protein